MIRRLTPAAALVAFVVAPLAGQLPLITVAPGTIRVDLAGALYPNDQIWMNGGRRPLGSIVGPTTNPILAGIQTNLAKALGQPATTLSLGTVTAIAAREHGVGNIGLAFGLSRHVTLFGAVPIVYVRSRVSVTADVSGANVGLNAGNATLGTPAGQQQVATFLSDLRTAITSLSTRIQRGDFANDPVALALAQRTVTSGTAARTAFTALLADPLLPTANDAYGTQLRAQITALQDTLSIQLGVTDFADPVPLPTTTMTTDQFAALLASPGGYGLASGNDIGRYSIGDLQTGVAVQLAEHGTVGSPSWRSLWAVFTASFPNGRPGSPTVLLDQAAGNLHPALQLDGIAEIGRQRFGVRGSVTYQHQLAWNTRQRLGSPDQVLVPPSFLAALRSQPGDSYAVTARPFLGIAQHLAIAGVVQYWRKASNRTRYIPGQLPVAGVDPSVLDLGSAADAVIVGIGLSYVHDGRRSDGSSGLPVEAAWSIERTVASGHGIFPAPLTSRMSLRIYRPFLRR